MVPSKMVPLIYSTMKRNTQSADTETVFGKGVGYQINRKGAVATFSVEGIDDADDSRISGYKELYRSFINESTCLTLGSYQVPLWGDGHNLYPQEVAELVNENKLLPGILRKQEDFLYGRGPMLYVQQVDDGRIVRNSVNDQDILQWLESWEQAGYPDYCEYLRCLIGDFYRVHTCVSQYHFLKGRRTNSYRTGSIRALSYVGADEARLAVKAEPAELLSRRMKQQDFDYVIVGNWANISGRQNYDIYHRFDPANPYRYPSPVAFDVMKSFAKHVYAYNDWFRGLRDWVKASNLTPKYLNSYLRNALNAHIHVKIPQAWVQAQRQNLEELCRLNLAETQAENRTKQYRGVLLIDPVTNKPYRFSVNMIEDLIAGELEKITTLLAGEGKNQGKLYATTKLGDEGWEFQDFPGKFKEYFDSVISYDKRADQVTLASIGMSASISNVENDGVISKSGSDVYYNYIVYLNSLAAAEHFVCKEINRAIALNFPDKYNSGVRLGFRIEIPSRQQDTTPSERLSQTEY